MVLGILVVPQRPRSCECVGDGDSAVWALLIADRYLCIVAVLFIGKMMKHVYVLSANSGSSWCCG